jgi:hypothetical protein
VHQKAVVVELVADFVLASEPGTVEDEIDGGGDRLGGFKRRAAVELVVGRDVMRR